MILEEGIEGLDNWPSRFKCPLGFTLQPWQHGDAVSFTPNRGVLGQALTLGQLMFAAVSTSLSKTATFEKPKLKSKQHFKHRKPV